MKLWLLRPVDGAKDADGDPWDPWYDKAFGFVIRATTEAIARNMAQDKGYDETRYRGDPSRRKRAVWTEPSLVSCIELTAAGEQEIVMLDFAAA